MGTDAPAALSVPDDLPDRPAAVTFKHDARSTVWAVAGEGPRDEGLVVKRFNAPRWQQAWRRALRMHPADRERRAHRALVKAGGPVVPHAGHGVDAAGRSWVATPRRGPSADRALAGAGDAELVFGGRGRQPLAARRRLVRAAGTLTGALWLRKTKNRDHKVSNLVLPPGGDGATLELIDGLGVGSTKGAPLFAAALPMLLRLRDSAAEAAARHADPRLRTVSRTDRLRFFRAAVDAMGGEVADGVHRLPRHAAFNEPRP